MFVMQSVFCVDCEVFIFLIQLMLNRIKILLKGLPQVILDLEGDEAEDRKGQLWQKVVTRYKALENQACYFKIQCICLKIMQNHQMAFNLSVILHILNPLT